MPPNVAYKLFDPFTGSNRCFNLPKVQIYTFHFCDSIQFSCKYLEINYVFLTLQTQFVAVSFPYSRVCWKNAAVKLSLRANYAISKLRMP